MPLKQLALKCIVREQRRFNFLQYFYETGRRHVNVIKQMQFSYDYSNILNGHI